MYLAVVVEMSSMTVFTLTRMEFAQATLRAHAVLDAGVTFTMILAVAPLAKIA
jgi:hypothetical protein